jgi:hypothetical protein
MISLTSFSTPFKICPFSLINSLKLDLSFKNNCALSLIEKYILGSLLAVYVNDFINENGQILKGVENEVSEIIPSRRTAIDKRNFDRISER